MMNRRMVLVGASAVAALVLTGCTSTPKEASQGASGSTSAAASGASSSSTGDFPFSPGKIEREAFVKPLMDKQRSLESFSIHMNSEGGSSTMQMTSEYEKVNGVDCTHSVIKTGDTVVEQIFIGQQGYSKNDDGSWEKGSGPSSMSVQQSLDAFEKSIKEVTYVNKDEHGYLFDLVVDLSSTLGPAATAEPMKLWLDDELRMVRTEQLSDLGDSAGSKLTVITTRDGFGKKYNIKAPI